MAMRQQQSDLLKSFTDVQQSMQSQMQKQAELQQHEKYQKKTVSNRNGIYANPEFLLYYSSTCCTES